MGRSTGKRKRRSRRQSRAILARRVSYIRRNIDCFDIPGEEGLSLIERNADPILRDTGMEFRNDPEILDYFRAAGAVTRPWPTSTG